LKIIKKSGFVHVLVSFLMDANQPQTSPHSPMVDYKYSMLEEEELEEEGAVKEAAETEEGEEVVE